MYSAFLPLKELLDMVVMVEVVMMRSQTLSTLSMECMKGEYTVALPDGRVQHVIYHADGGYGGTIMEVKYSGEAHHPEYHSGGHGGHV